MTVNGKRSKSKILSNYSIDAIGIGYWCLVGLLSILLSNLGAIAAPYLAEPRRIDYTLSSQANQTFSGLMQQAEALAENLVKQAFAQNPGLTEVSITIVGKHNGQEVPLLFSRVSRSNWQKEPRIQPWTRYASTSARLLGFSKPKVPQSVAKQPVFDQVGASMSDIEPNFYQ